jgi:hypothetical protein
MFMRKFVTAWILLLPATIVAAEERQVVRQGKTILKPGDHVVVVRDDASFSNNGGDLGTLEWGTLLKVNKVNGDYVSGIAKLEDEEIAGWVAIRDVKPVLNTEGLVRFTCPGMG